MNMYSVLIWVTDLQYYKFFNSIYPVCFDSVSLSINHFTEHFNAIFYDCSTGTASALLMRNNET